MKTNAPPKARILVADAERGVLRLCLRSLSEVGHDVVGVYNGAEAIEWLKANEPPGLVLIDVMMPQVDGAEVLQWIRANKHLSGIPVVMFLGRSPFEDEQNTPAFFNENGVDIALYKPFNESDIVTVVERVLTRVPHQ